MRPLSSFQTMSGARRLGGIKLQQAKRWRRRRQTNWQILIARVLLAIAVVVTISPSTRTTGGIVLAQDAPLPVRQSIADDDTHPEHAFPDEGEPVAPPQEPVPAVRPAFAPQPDAQPTHVAEPTQEDTAPVRAAEIADDVPMPVAESPADDDDATVPTAAQDVAPVPATTSHRVAYPQPSQAAASASCPADFGHAKSAAFGRDDRLVMTYYYYWYDEASLEDPALSQRPPAYPALDWRSVSWHERQLTDMATAGIDVALAVYWGDTATWSLDGLDAMVTARENLLASGLRAPAVGLFFDTNMYAMILPERPELNDLTTIEGLDMLADQIGGFLDRVPPCHRARVDGRPLAFFWRADTEDGDQFKFDSSTFDNITDIIAARYDERLHPVVEQSWVEAARRLNVEIGAADVYRWGAALNGPRFEGRTVAIGPGYDDTRIGGRPGYTRERVDGGTYSRDLRQAVMSGTPWLLLETWNELWEGTAIAETEETGRTYLGITARYTALFHQLAWERARDAWFDLGHGYNAYLRRLADAPVEQGMPAEELGRRGARPWPEEDGTGYFHFALDRRLGLDQPRPLTVFVEYFDEGEGSFALEYDSLDPMPAAISARPEAAPRRHAPELADEDDGSTTMDDGDLASYADETGEAVAAEDTVAADPSHPGPADEHDPVYKRTAPVLFENTRSWRVARFDLPDASLRHRQYDGAGDFRLHDSPGSDERLHTFGRVMVTAVLASRPVPYEPESLAFVDPGPRESVILRWTEGDPAPGYLIIVQPFDVVDDTDLHGFTADDRRRCVGEAEGGSGLETRGLSRHTACELRLARDLPEGIYRWRVQALDTGGSGQGETSDWGYFVVARR